MNSPTVISVTHPVVAVVSISWEHTEEIVLSLDQYESTRPPRRTHFEMVLPRDLRQHMLRKEWDVTQSQIASAVRTNIKIKNQRRSTVNNLGKATRMEEMMEKAGRKVMRGFLLKKSTSKQVADLDRQMDLAEQARASLSFDDEEHEGDVPTEDTKDETCSV